jgi:hypothetical protein
MLRFELFSTLVLSVGFIVLAAWVFVISAADTQSVLLRGEACMTQ